MQRLLDENAMLISAVHEHQKAGHGAEATQYLRRLSENILRMKAAAGLATADQSIARARAAAERATAADAAEAAAGPRKRRRLAPRPRAAARVRDATSSGVGRPPSEPALDSSPRGVA